MLASQDPTTGDELTRSEALSLFAQSIIRRWSFIATFSAITAVVWIFGSPVAMNWWNYSASWLALVIESVVGIGVFQMSRRDAVILREIHQMDKELQEQTEAIHNLTERLDQTSEAIFDHMLRNER